MQILFFPISTTLPRTHTQVNSIYTEVFHGFQLVTTWKENPSRKCHLSLRTCRLFNVGSLFCSASFYSLNFDRYNNHIAMSVQKSVYFKTLLYVYIHIFCFLKIHFQKTFVWDLQSLPLCWVVFLQHSGDALNLNHCAIVFTP